MPATTHTNGLLSPPHTEKASSVSSPPRVVLAGKKGRILCVADIRGDYHELNKLIREHEATAVIHTGDFGFINAESLDRMGDKILRHLLQYSPLIPPATRNQLLSIPAVAGRATLVNELNNSSIHFPLSQFPHLLSGAITFTVPVFTVWGLIEDVRVLEKFRTGEYEVQNLTIIDEASPRLVETGGVKLRLFGLGGAVALHKMFDHGEGQATIAGGLGTMWATAFQMGELVDTAQRVYDPTETRVFISSAPIGRNGILSMLGQKLGADLTISGGLHFRYPSSFNEFAVHSDFDAYREKLKQARDNFMGVYTTVKERVDASMNDQQKELLKKAMAVAMSVPEKDDGTWTNTWHWALTDASCGHMVLSVSDGRVGAEIKSSGLNFAHRANQTAAPPSASTTQSTPLVQQPVRQIEAPMIKPTNPAVTRPSLPVTAGVPPKPAARQGPGSIMNNVKGILPRQLPQSGALPPARATPPGPAASTSNASVPSSVPAKPPTQPRQPRGPPPHAAQSPSALAVKDKVPEVQPTESSKSPAPPKPTSAQANGKPATPTPVSRERTKPTPIAQKKSASETKINGTGTPANAGKVESKDKDDKEKAGEEGKDGKAGHSREGSGSEELKMVGTPRKQSLYIKGIPIPTTEDELKALFPALTGKITAVKIIQDHLSKRQKDFAYVDFESESDMQNALKDHKTIVRDTTVSVTVSNPPAKALPFSGRGRGSFRGRGGGMRNHSFGKKEEGGGGNGGNEGGDEKKSTPAPVPAGGDRSG